MENVSSTRTVHSSLGRERIYGMGPEYFDRLLF